ncbi:MAG: protein phosphatase 2C domain-containing protein [Deltaproteobacteria bacterium]|nr:protein phosphatase 2C domain-containing protein [Deltaproteobacteria bacterium]
MSAIVLKTHGMTHVGKVREANEDAMIVDPRWGLYAVLDGMGGAMAGDVASNRARDVIHEYVRAKKKTLEPRALLEAAITAASSAVHGEAQARRDRQGMGTTLVMALFVDDNKAWVAHVGDSRAYLLRDGRLTQLTRDHTVVAELMAQGALSPAEAENHAYKNVLSRNLGAKAEARPDLLELELVAGDRLMLCSDGLYGYASTDATSGAVAWWARRQAFLGAARERGLARSPICAVLSPDEAIDIVAGNLAEAIFHDLEKSTGVNVWTYAENLAHGWFDQGGAWAPLAEMLDLLVGAAHAVVVAIAHEDQALALLVETAVQRAFTTAEMAVGGVLAERLRVTEGELIKAHTLVQTSVDESARFQETPTIPFMPAARPVADLASPEVRAHLQAVAQAARGVVGTGRVPARNVIDAIERAALDPVNATGSAIQARELYGVRALEESGVSPLFDALDQGRAAFVTALRRAGGDPQIAVAVMRRVASAQLALAAALAGLVVEGAAPISERLREATRETASLRAEVASNEARLADLERQYATRAAKPSMLPRLPRKPGGPS